MSTTDVFISLSTVFVAVLVIRSFLGKERLPYPPGPNGLPLIGNVFDMKSGALPQRLYAQWSREFCSRSLQLCICQLIIGATSIRCHSLEYA